MKEGGEGQGGGRRWTYHDIIALELERIRLYPLPAQPLPIDERPIRALHVLDVYLAMASAIAAFPGACLHATQKI
jgi:hypothetical protein